MSQPQKLSGSSWAIIAITAYLMSPFPAVWAISLIYGGISSAPDTVRDSLILFYLPIILAAEKYSPIGNFYLWGFKLLDVW